MDNTPIFLILALLSSITMGMFYIMDMFFESRGVYSRPSQAMIVSSIMPLLTVPFFVFNPWWHNVPMFIWIMAFISGAFLIWANWFYFLVMFPIDKNNKEAEAIEGATELALYEGTTPAVVLVLSMIVSQFIVYTDNISVWQGVGIIITVIGLISFALSDGFVGFNRWAYRIKLITFALLVAISQIIQDLAVNYAQDSGLDVVEAYVSISPIVWLGMFSGILIVFWKKEWKLFRIQWNSIIKKYVWLILFAEIVALASYATLIGSYTGEHVAVSGALAASFPIIVFLGGLTLQKFNIQKTESFVDTSHIFRKFMFILLTLVGIAGVILF